MVKVSRICCDGKDIDTASVGDGLHVYFKGQDLVSTCFEKVHCSNFQPYLIGLLFLLQDLANKYILCDRIHPISGVRKFKAGVRLKIIISSLIQSTFNIAVNSF